MNDYFGKNCDALADKKLFLFDMDGTIYEGNRLFEGTRELLAALGQKGVEYMFITNNSSRSVAAYVDKLHRLGIETDAEHFFTSSMATALLIREQYPGVKVYVQGTKSLIEELTRSGITVTTEVEPDVGLVLTGFDTELTFQKIVNTCLLLKRDLPYYATNPDLRCPAEECFLPDCGSIAVAIYNCTGKTPIYIGKPEPTMIDLARTSRGISAGDTVVVGDRLYTDIASAVNAKVDSICVLSGEAGIDDIMAFDKKPTYVLNDVRDVLKALLQK